MKQFTPLRKAFILFLMLVAPVTFAGQPSIALFYGANPPWDELRAFDIVVVEPQHVLEPKAHANDKTALFAYVSVGEVDADRPYLKLIPEAWKSGRNADWGSVVLDQSQPGWPSFFAEQVIKPLWDAGYRGFFLDTLDSYQLVARTEADRARQEAGLVAVIRELRKRYPEARLIFNRGFEILPQVHPDAFAVAAESIFQGWSQARKSYQPVPAADREWLLGQLGRVKQEYKLPVLAIDYVPPGKRDLARETAARIRELGFIPWVSNPELDMLGVGEIEVMPRKVLMIQNGADSEYDLINTQGLRFGTMPLNYLGYTVEYLDARQPLPAYPLAGRYAGVAVWLDKPTGKEGKSLAAWLEKQVAAGVPVALLGEMDFLLAGGAAKRLGLKYSTPPIGRAPLRITRRESIARFEVDPVQERQTFFSLQAIGGKPLLTLTDDRDNSQEAVAITPWGGYAINPHVLVDRLGVQRNKEGEGDGGKNVRWVINPIEFMRQALKLPDMPVPDVTTESGRRLLMVHMDGDGFASKAEFPGAPYAAEVLRDRILKKYPLPATISVIQGEIAPNGMYPALSSTLEKIARSIFAMPQVEIASHSFSHPFSWEMASQKNKTGDESYHLSIPGYIFDLQSEIPGSIRYIESRLAPPGKRVKVFLWTGNCNAGADALELTERSGVLNMNDGDTLITRSNPSLALVAPLGVAKKGRFQVYAPNQNENVYTNNWTGPFYGYERVIETFELTGAPFRLKPIDIYFHTYSASKPASLNALDKVFRWALEQETTPVQASDYIRKVLDFNHLVVARSPDGWRVRGAENLRELRAPAALGQPDLGASRAVAGFNRHGDNLYLHLADSEADIRLRPDAADTPYLVSANARVERMTRASAAGSSTLSLTLRGQVPLKFTLTMDARCAVRADGHPIKAVSKGNGVGHFSIRNHAIEELRVHCPR